MQYSVTCPSNQLDMTVTSSIAISSGWYCYTLNALHCCNMYQQSHLHNAMGAYYCPQQYHITASFVTRTVNTWFHGLLTP